MPALLLVLVLEYVLQQISVGRWDRIIPILLVVACSALLWEIPPEAGGGPGYLLLAIIVALTALVPLPAFSYALDHMSKLWAVLIAATASLTIVFLLLPSPETGLGRFAAEVAGVQGAAVWPFVGLGLFVYGLFTAGMGYALALFIDEVADRMSSVFSGLVFGVLLLLLGLGIGEAVAGGLLAFALLQYVRILPEKGIHMFMLFPVVLVALVLTAYTQSYRGMVGSEAFIMAILVPAVAVITPFVILETQILTRREGIGVVIAGVIALPVVSLVLTRSLTIEGLNAFGSMYAPVLDFQEALIQWAIVYGEVLLIALAFYLIVVMGLGALRRPASQI